MTGKTISHYRLLEKLGQGGMGVIYKAEDTKLKRLVALKFLPPDLTRDEEAKERFVNEAQAASALDHPNLCTIYEIDEDEEGRMFIAMAYYEGETLQKKVASGKLQVADAIEIAIQIAQGLAKAHEHGIIHRDIKPANVMITNDGLAKILDFGVAKLSGRAQLTKTGGTLGTVAYMSPEQTRGTNVDHRTDIWALGVVLYEMITGELPFKGEHEATVMYSIWNEEPEPIISQRPEAAAELDRVVSTALAKASDERYQHADEMLVDLKAVQKAQDSGLQSPAKTRARSRTKIRPVLTKKLQFLFGGIAVLAVLAVAAFFVSKERLPDAVEKESIAVLPFVNMSAEAENEYFSDGMTEEIINALTKVKGLAVVARTTVFQFKGKTYDIRKFGEQLSVSTILEGSVRKSGEKMRITAQLINVTDGYHLWSEVFEVREMNDIFVVQDEIAREIVSKLKVELGGGSAAPLVKASTESREAYDLYLRGRFFWNDRGRENLSKAIDYFERAIALDSSFAAAYAGLADTYGLLHQSRDSSPHAYQKAKWAATKALELDSTLAEAHAALGVVQGMFEWNWLEVETAYKRAIALNPGYASAHQWYAAALMHLGRPREAIAEAKKALELDPLALPKNMMLIQVYRNARQYDLALDQCRKTLELYPANVNAQWGIGMAYVHESRYDEGIASLRQSLENSTNRPALLVAGLGYALAVSGKRTEAQAVLDELHARSDQKAVSPCFLAWIYAGLGQQEQAVEMLERAYDERDYRLLYIKVDPMFDNLRSHPRFDQLLKRMGFG